MSSLLSPVHLLLTQLMAQFNTPYQRDNVQALLAAQLSQESKTLYQNQWKSASALSRRAFERISSTFIDGVSAATRGSPNRSKEARVCMITPTTRPDVAVGRDLLIGRSYGSATADGVLSLLATRGVAAGGLDHAVELAVLHRARRQLAERNAGAARRGSARSRPRPRSRPSCNL